MAARTSRLLALAVIATFGPGCADVLGFDALTFSGATSEGGADVGGSGGTSDASPDGPGPGGWAGAGGTAGSAGTSGSGGTAGSSGTAGAGGTAGSGGSPAACPNSACDPGEDCQSCPQDCGPCPIAEPDQLVGIHFWDGDASSVMGATPYYDVEAFESAVSPSTVVDWVTQREGAGARVIVRIDYAWGNSIPKSQGERDTYGQRMLSIAQAVRDAGLQSHHYIVGNESNLPQEGGASPSEVGQAYAAARAAIDGGGPWPNRPMLLSTPPSTAAQYGGGDGSYLHDLLVEIRNRTTLDAIAIHAYENADSGGSANLFIATVQYQAQAILNAGVAGVPIFVTEMNVDINQMGDGTAATFLSNAYARLHAWNQGQEGNPSPGTLSIAAGCWFVWHNDGNWTHLALNESSHPQTRAAFQAAAAAGYPSAWP